MDSLQGQILLRIGQINQQSLRKLDFAKRHDIYLLLHFKSKESESDAFTYSVNIFHTA